MKRLFALFLSLGVLLGGCAPLVIGGLAGYGVEHHYAHKHFNQGYHEGWRNHH